MPCVRGRTGAARRLGNLRYGRLGSLRYVKLIGFLRYPTIPAPHLPAFEHLGHPELCQNGTLRITDWVGRGHGGDTVGIRGLSGAAEGSFQCAILAHNPLLTSNVNQPSLPPKPCLPEPAQRPLEQLFA
jgi:hypothetical protein